MRGPRDEGLPGEDTAQSKPERRLQLFRLARGLPERPAAPAATGQGRTSRARTTAAARQVDEESAFGAAHAEAARERSGARRSAIAGLGQGAAPGTAAGPPVGGPAWQSLGPTEIPNGQTYGSGPGSRVNVSGRVAAIAVDPSNAAHVLVGSAWRRHLGIVRQRRVVGATNRLSADPHNRRDRI